MERFITRTPAGKTSREYPSEQVLFRIPQLIEGFPLDSDVFLLFFHSDYHFA